MNFSYIPPNANIELKKLISKIEMISSIFTPYFEVFWKLTPPEFPVGFTMSPSKISRNVPHNRTVKVFFLKKANLTASGPPIKMSSLQKRYFTILFTKKTEVDTCHNITSYRY